MHMVCHAHTYEISGCGYINLPLCPTKDFQYWSHIFAITIFEIYKKIIASPSKNSNEKEEKKNKKTRIVSA